MLLAKPCGSLSSFSAMHAFLPSYACLLPSCEGPAILDASQGTQHRVWVGNGIDPCRTTWHNRIGSIVPVHTRLEMRTCMAIPVGAAVSDIEGPGGFSFAKFTSGLVLLIEILRQPHHYIEDRAGRALGLDRWGTRV